MALLPLLGALVVSQGATAAPTIIQIHSQVYRADGFTITGGSHLRYTRAGDLGILEGADLKDFFKANKLTAITSPTLRTLEGMASEITMQLESETYSLKYTPKFETSGSVKMTADFDLAGTKSKSAFVTRYGETYIIQPNKGSMLILLKVDQVKP